MKTRIMLLSLIVLMSAGIQKDNNELVRMRCTCYTWTGNRTASGVYPYEGIVAGRPQDIGKSVRLYTEDGELIGTFLIADTGGHYIRSGQRLDIYRDTLQGCHDWINQYGDYLLVKFLPEKIMEVKK